MHKYNIGANLITIIKSLYEKATGAVLYNGNTGDWFRTTVGFRQGCLLSPTLFNIFLEKIMTDALQNHEGTVKIGGRIITNLRFADDIDELAGKEEELENLVKKMETASTAYGMEISPEKTKIMSNNANGLTKTIKVKGHNLETVTNFKYLGAIVTDEGTKREVLTRIARATSPLTELKTVWKDRKITSKHRIQILFSIVTSTFLYACETWTLTAELERRIQTFEMRCYSKIFGISFRDRITNKDVRNRVRAAIGPHDDLLSIVKTRKLRWYGHVTRARGLGKHHHAGHATRWEETRQTEIMLARRHQGMDGAASRQDPETSRRQRRLEKDHQNICGAPTAPQRLGAADDAADDDDILKSAVPFSTIVVYLQRHDITLKQTFCSVSPGGIYNRYQL